MTQKSKHWDIFCCVVDNYGDIGVTWRLAKQLTQEYDLKIKLWVDDLNSFQHILPALNPNLNQQTINAITIIKWDNINPNSWQAGEALIEAFACEIPESIIEQLAEDKTNAPVWLNLEYLSAESWIEDCHGLQSLHHSGVKKYFYFPGFTSKSGGLICEHNQLTIAKHHDLERSEYLKQFGIELKETNTKVISVFSYESSALKALCKYWQTLDSETHLLVPLGRSLNSLLPAFQGQVENVNIGDCFTVGKLQIHILPMTDQEGYDKLLSSCDFNIVRGEDSFLRAQWAQKPFLWHIYPQDEHAHIDKLEAFNSRYLDSLPNSVVNAYQNLSLAFNQDQEQHIVTYWQQLQEYEQALLSHSLNWPNKALNGSDLASRLVEFVKKR
ncbi:elongation factor P maturation arginine rhamnosyltransferase EarP [Parashewanella tropica]|uniref:elongation factor P maturation arginine rhamnosyltransferase EarP n=1 Tax=Parashewanella tropica TaxID=2547970 RepID=UPI00105A7C35|nr:elongation factor P maturation arginine rhamnosyltransferase EarP [Parashewanella tropica]